MQKVMLSFLALLLFETSCQDLQHDAHQAMRASQSITNDSSKRTDQDQAQLIKPELIAPGIINKAGSWSFTPALSKDGNTMILVRWDRPNLRLGDQSIQQLFRSEWINGQWSEPVEVTETSGHRVDYPHFSPDGRSFYLSYNKYHSGQYNYPNESKWDDFDIWRADCDERGNIDWSTFAPITYGEINRPKTPQNASIRYVHNETSPRADLKGHLYFWSERLDTGIGRRDIFKYTPGQGTTVLPEPINSRYRESGVCVTQDGQKMIFASDRPEGNGQSDLYYTEKQADGAWSTPINLGAQINSAASEACPQLARNDELLIFTSSRDIPGVEAVDGGEGAYHYGVYSVAIKDILAIR